MHDLYNLKDMLMKELDEYSSKDELTAGSLEIVDKLTHTIKNLCKIMEEDESEYSGRRSYEGGNMSYRRNSYARRRDSMGRYSRRYSNDGGMVEELRELMESAPDDRTRMEFEKFIKKVEQM